MKSSLATSLGVSFNRWRSYSIRHVCPITVAVKNCMSNGLVRSFFIGQINTLRALSYKLVVGLTNQYSVYLQKLMVITVQHNLGS